MRYADSRPVREVSPLVTYLAWPLRPPLSVGDAIARFGVDAVPQYALDDPLHHVCTVHGLGPRWADRGSPIDDDHPGVPYVLAGFVACGHFGLRTLAGAPACRICYVPPADPPARRRKS